MVIFVRAATPETLEKQPGEPRQPPPRTRVGMQVVGDTPHNLVDRRLGRIRLLRGGYPFLRTNQKKERGKRKHPKYKKKKKDTHPTTSACRYLFELDEAGIILGTVCALVDLFVQGLTPLSNPPRHDPALAPNRRWGIKMAAAAFGGPKKHKNESIVFKHLYTEYTFCFIGVLTFKIA